MKPIFFLFLTLTLVISSCLPDDDCPYIFVSELPFTLSPQKDSFHIGDTIWVSADFHHTITDLKTGEKATFRDFDFLTDIGFFKIDMNPFVYADSMFQRFAVKGKLQFAQLIGATTNYVTYDYNGENYQVEFGFIPKEVGLFTFTVSSPTLSNRNHVITHSDCKIRSENHHIYYKLNNGADINYHLHLLAEDPSLLEKTTEEALKQIGGYCFYVVE